MSELRTILTNTMKEGMKAGQSDIVATIRLVNAKIKETDIEARAKGNAEGIADSEILSLMQGMIKQRQESAAVYRQGNREDLAAKEDAEIVIIQRFLPAQLSDAEAQAAIAALVAETGASSVKDMGKVMAAVKTKYAGQMDMTKASAFVKTALAG